MALSILLCVEPSLIVRRQILNILINLTPFDKHNKIYFVLLKRLQSEKYESKQLTLKLENDILVHTLRYIERFAIYSVKKLNIFLLKIQTQI